MARDHTVQFKDAFGEEMSPRVLAERMGQFVHQFTCYGGARPLGINLLFAGYDNREKKYDLYRISPTGQHYVGLSPSVLMRSVTLLKRWERAARTAKRTLRNTI